MPRLYHLDGTVCIDGLSCRDEEHTSIPPACGAVPASGPAGSTVACELPSGHPGPHLHLATGCEY